MHLDRFQIRPMLADDVAAAQASSFAALSEAGSRYGYQLPVLDEPALRIAQQRFAHLLRTDPAGCWVADSGGEIVGVGLALRRGRLWFLSLLTVSRQAQSGGLGRRLLDAALGTSADATAGLIMSSADPKALRRYSLAGFDLIPGYKLTGAIDRSLLPAIQNVRAGSFEDDRDLVDGLGLALRGAAYGPDLAAYREAGHRLVVTDAPDGRGFAVIGSHGLVVLGASTEPAASRLLWFALAESAPDAEWEIEAITAGQQWAIRVGLAARLSLVPAESLCTRGAIGPLTPYLPGGAYG